MLQLNLGDWYPSQEILFKFSVSFLEIKETDKPRENLFRVFCPEIKLSRLIPKPRDNLFNLFSEIKLRRLTTPSYDTLFSIFSATMKIDDSRIEIISAALFL